MRLSQFEFLFNFSFLIPVENAIVIGSCETLRFFIIHFLWPWSHFKLFILNYRFGPIKLFYIFWEDETYSDENHMTSFWRTFTTAFARRMMRRTCSHAFWTFFDIHVRTLTVSHEERYINLNWKKRPCNRKRTE